MALMASHLLPIMNAANCDDCREREDWVKYRAAAPHHLSSLPADLISHLLNLEQSCNDGDHEDLHGAPGVGDLSEDEESALGLDRQGHQEHD